MEIWKISILAGLITFAIVSCILLIYVTKRNFDKRLYVYSKSGNKYVLVKGCRLKCPMTGYWHDAVIYKSINNGELYVRNKTDFMSKFYNYGRKD